jgi:cytohesin
MDHLPAARELTQQLQTIDSYDELHDDSYNYCADHALMWAICCRAEKIALSLLRLPLHIDTHTEGYRLEKAAEVGLKEFVSRIISRGYVTDRQYYTQALINICCSIRSDPRTALEIAQLLIEHDANPQDTNREEYALGYAAGTGKADLLRLLLSYETADDARNLCQSLLSNMLDDDFEIGGQLDGDNEQILHILLEYGANPLARNLFGMPLLHVAAMNGRRGALRVFLQHGISPNEQAHEMPLLHRAIYQLNERCTARNVQAIQELLQHGADATQRNNLQETALLMTCKYSRYADQAHHLSIANLLLTHGADPNAQDAWGMTPLHWAIRRGPVEMVGLLLAHGARSDLETLPRHEIEYHIAQQRPTVLKTAQAMHDIATLLQDHGVSLEPQPASIFLDSSETAQPSDPDRGFSLSELLWMDCEGVVQQS